MAKTIEPHLISIQNYLKIGKEVLFNIPEYQRAYSWDITRCDKLWTDICEYTNKGKVSDGYFLGTIIINCINNDTQFDLIDGQQRTTTFILLLKAFLIKINEILKGITNTDEESENFLKGLKTRRDDIMSILYNIDKDDVPDKIDKENDKKLYKNVILKNNSINEDKEYKEELKNILFSYDFDEAQSKVIKIKNKKNDNKYTNFFKNFKYFYNKIDELENNIRLNEIIKGFLENCQVIEIKSWNVEQAISMFNSLNSDGMPLSDSDIISSKLYSYIAEDERMAFNESWVELKS